MEACVGAHHLSRRLQALGHDARLMPAKYVRPYSKGQKNDFRDAEAIAEAVQRPTMKFVATESIDQLDLQALHRVRERLVGQRSPAPGLGSGKVMIFSVRSPVNTTPCMDPPTLLCRPEFYRGLQPRRHPPSSLSPIGSL
jgi:Transposase